MKNKSILLILISLAFGLKSQAQSNGLALGALVAPISKDAQVHFNLQYNFQNQKSYSLRTYLHFGLNTDKEVRTDSIALHKGDVNYSIALGIVRNIKLNGKYNAHFYYGLDYYHNSRFLRPADQTYYGYFYDFGLRPVLGLRSEIVNQLNLFIESRSDFNVNLQGYTGAGLNYDRRFSFRAYDHIALGFSYDLK